VTAARPSGWSLKMGGAQALFFVATCVAVPVSAVPPADLAVRLPSAPPAAPAPVPVATPAPALPATVAVGIPSAGGAAPTPPAPAPAPVAAAAPAPPAARRPAPRAAPPARPRTAPVPRSAASTFPVGATVIRIGTWSTTVERGDQAVVDRCKATLFWGPWPAERPGTVWLAGHDHCGYGFWADLPMGTIVAFHGPYGTVSYVIVGRTWLPRKGGPSQGLIHDDLILQTCQGQGTSLTYGARSD